MDNASKALIMAGAILISVAIVGIGIYIFSTASSLTDDAVGQIDSLAVSAVNSRLENYLGGSVRGSSVIQLLREVEVLNANGSMPNPVTVTGVTEATVKSNQRYSVTVSGRDNAGYITSIAVAGVTAPAGS